MQIRIGINGFGRIGRLLTRILTERQGLTLSHINDPAYAPDLAAHLLLHDSTHGQWPAEVEASASGLTINGRLVSLTRERDIAATGWGGKADIVVDCSGRLKAADQLKPYLDQGVRRAVLSAPISGAPNIVMGVNDQDYDGARHPIVSAASCTTNCLAVVMHVLHEEFHIRHGFITTIHAVTNDQAVLDQAHEDWRRGRSAYESLIPTSSGFAKTIGLVIPSLAGKLDGYAVRAPVSNASLIDCAFVLEHSADAVAVNECLTAAAQGPLRGILAVESKPLVSADYKGNTHSAIIDTGLTRALAGHHLKLVAWYDNETGYAHRLADLVQKIATQL